MKLILQLLGLFLAAGVLVLIAALLLIKTGLPPWVIGVIAGIAVIASKTLAEKKSALRHDQIKRPPSLELTEKEEKLAKSVGLSQEIVSAIKKIANANLEQFLIPPTDIALECKRTEPYPGIEFASEQHSTFELICKLKEQTHYQVFVCEYGTTTSIDKICVVQLADQFELLRLLQVTAVNYDITAESLITRLKSWDKRYGLDLYGADTNTVEVYLQTTPENPQEIADFAHEVLEFCPDAESTVDIINQIKKNKRLFLWWD